MLRSHDFLIYIAVTNCRAGGEVTNRAAMYVCMYVTLGSSARAYGRKYGAGD